MMNDFATNDAAVQRLFVESIASSAHNVPTKVSSLEELGRNIRLMAKKSHFTPTKEDESTEVAETDEEDAHQEYRDFAGAEESHRFPLTFDDIRLQKLPTKLNAMLSDPENNHIISWMPHGRAWKVWKKKEFIKDVLPKYFEYCNYNSFVRLVNAWGFRRITSGLDANAYYHELFLRGMPHLHNKMHRLKKNQKKAPSTLRSDPDFYAMDKVSPLPSADHNSEVDTMKSRSLEVNQNKLTLMTRQVPQLSPHISAGATSQLGNAQLTNYLVGQQQHQKQLTASALYQGLNQNAIVANQLFAQQQRQISLSLPANLLGGVLTNNNTASARVATQSAVLPVSNNIGGNPVLDAATGYGNNNTAALNILRSIQQQQQQRFLSVVPATTNVVNLLNSFQR